MAENKVAAFIKEGIAKGYKFDGCTDSPDFNFEDCCNLHDYAYQDLTISRAEADANLRKCMQKKGWILLPWLYWGSVRMFGGSHWKGVQNEALNKVITTSTVNGNDGPN